MRAHATLTPMPCDINQTDPLLACHLMQNAISKDGELGGIGKPRENVWKVFMCVHVYVHVYVCACVCVYN